MLSDTPVVSAYLPHIQHGLQLCPCNRCTMCTITVFTRISLMSTEHLLVDFFFFFAICHFLVKYAFQFFIYERHFSFPLVLSFEIFNVDT